MELLKLMAMDKEDLSIISAYMQDAVFKPADLDFQSRDGRFLLVGNRFVWEESNGKRRRGFERRRSALHFNRVGAVRSRGVNRRDDDAVLSLLTVNFVPGEDEPGGRVELIFSGDVAVELDVECVEAQMSDLGAAWETEFKPAHPLSDV
ncbi:DUF2948 family protein [Hoeflea prorocentri]|uniref:DUF2948 family protein n=1 Tax=Hoeflea prorocentri TaxID=1922333 RepID=A0A9X3ZIH0_9HYPH|nr:DUF2948 family protein [Hoeflea prorocentri]MCY6382439.1 DUF2948 family protein [Hoeflea prorocentri]MDA5400239.1 DUF2948 family protein [Hoeflea prorocentri]